MPSVNRPESTAEAEKRISVWRLSELQQWGKLGLLPTKRNMDIEYYCSFLGAYEIASGFQGVSVLVHGPSGCVESFQTTRPFPGLSARHKPKVLSTDMRLKDVVYGAAAKLTNAMLQTDRDLHPRLIVVLTNCCADIIGEDVGAAIRRVEGEVKADIINIESGGCSGNGFRVGADKVFEALFAHLATKPASPRTARPSVNVFTKRLSGRPAEIADLDELERILAKCGIALNTSICLGASYDDLCRIPAAHANASLCYLFGDGPMKVLNERFGQPYARATFPIGVKGTLEWVQAIAAVLGVDPRPLFDDPEVALYREKIENARRRYAGREAFIWAPGEKGLALARFAAELGMRPCLYSMGYLMAEELRGTIDLLLEAGCDFPAVLTGKQDILLSYADRPFAERPMLIMPRKFWAGELPTATVNPFADSLLGLKGIDALLAIIDRAVARAGRKDYALFNRFVETRFEARRWDLDGPAIAGVTGPAAN
jgi:nitrogenase molybdenum-iron protein alpha/beta subunit